jgi:excisionase family DNA binding protein
MYPDRSDYLKIDEAARMLGVSARTVYRWIWKGELPASKVGGLYFIPRGELLNRLHSNRTAGSSFDPAPPPTSTTLKCGYCFQLIAGEAQIGEICLQEGCEQMICTRCSEAGIQYCAAHQPDRAQRLAEAQAQHQSGKVPLLVTGESARLREISFTNRIQARLAGITALLHPASGELINVADWDCLAETVDERLEVMRMLGKVLLDADTLARMPLNPTITYLLPKDKKQKGSPVEIQVRVLSRLKRFFQVGL